MKVEWREHRGPLVDGEHVLVFAEPGFSALDIYGTAAGLDRAELKEFASRVNERAETGSLLPRAPISAVPRAAVRNNEDPDVLEPFLSQMLGAIGDGQVHASILRIDLATPGLSAAARTAIESAVSRTVDDRLAALRLVIVTGDP